MRAIILHGTKGSPQGNWFPWLASELEKLDIETAVPALPTPANQSLESWRKAFQDQCGDLDSKTILIGHSTGAILAMRLIEDAITSIFSTVLVSPPGKQIGIPEFDELNSTFFEKDFDWAKIISNSGKLFYFMGDNDQYVPQIQLLETAGSLKIKPIIVKGGGHLNAETGFTAFPLLLDSLKPSLSWQHNDM